MFQAENSKVETVIFAYIMRALSGCFNCLGLVRVVTASEIRIFEG